MSGGGGIIIISGKDANGIQGVGHQTALASAEAALAVLQANDGPPNFIAALEQAIADANT